MTAGTEQAAAYAFGDSPAALERLGVVARVFHATSRSFLRSLAPGARVVDLGCGPGHTTALLADLFPHARVIGVDRSAPFLAAARHTVPVASFVAADVTIGRLPGTPADLVYARFVLSHLANRGTVLRTWFAALDGGGLLALEDPERIDTDDTVFRSYLEITHGLVAHRGGLLCAGGELASAVRELDGCVVHDDVADVAPSTAEVALMFALNLRAWRDDPWVAARWTPADLDRLGAGLDERRAATDRGRIRWVMRQVAVASRA